jgi:hypothetical protein
MLTLRSIFGLHSRWGCRFLTLSIAGSLSGNQADFKRAPAYRFGSSEPCFSILIQLVQLLQIQLRGHLQDIEVMLTGVPKTRDVPMKSGTPIVIFADPFVE